MLSYGGVVVEEVMALHADSKDRMIREQLALHCNTYVSVAKRPRFCPISCDGQTSIGVRYKRKLVDEVKLHSPRVRIS